MNEKTHKPYIRARNGMLEIVVRRDGRTVTRSTGLRVGQEAEADALLHQVLAEAVPKPRLTVRQYGDTWVEDRIARGVKDALNEQANLRYHVYPLLGDRPLTDVTKAEALTWVRGLQGRLSEKTGKPLAARTVHHIAGTLKRMFREAVKTDVVAVDPCVWSARADLPKKKDTDAARRRMGGLEAWEAWALTHDARLPLDRRAYYAALLYTGARPGEIAPRRWKDLVDESDGHQWGPLPQFAVTTAWNTRSAVESEGGKTGVEKLIPRHPELDRILAAWRAEWARYAGHEPGPEDLLFPGERGGMRNVSHANSLFKQDLEALELRGGRTLYSTRATFFSTAQAGGASKADVMLITHPSPSEAADLYRRLHLVWPAMCRTVLAARYAPRNVPVLVQTATQEHRRENEKAPPLAEMGPRGWRAIQDSNLWPSAPEADALSI